MRLAMQDVWSKAYAVASVAYFLYNVINQPILYYNSVQMPNPIFSVQGTCVAQRILY